MKKISHVKKSFDLFFIYYFFNVCLLYTHTVLNNEAKGQLNFQTKINFLKAAILVDYHLI